MRGWTLTIALLAGLFVCVSAAAVRAQAYAPDVILSVTLPNGQSQELKAPESGLAQVSVDGRQYGFRPTMHDGQGTRITVTVFDMGSATEAVREIGATEVKGGGPAVATKTTPSFRVQARKATASTPTT